MFSLPVLEISRFNRTLMTRLALVIIVIIPTFYGGVYLVANWNPTGNLGNLTAAIVNSDLPAEVDGDDDTPPTQLAAGEQLTSTLIGGDTAGFTWVEATDAEAAAGLENGTYAAVLRIPATFSRSLVSLGGESPQSTNLTITTNDAQNYITGNIANSILASIRTSFANTTVARYLDNVYVGFNNIHDSIGRAADGAAQLTDGATRLADGTGSLVSGLQQLDDGAHRLADGAQTLADGAGRAADGAAALSQGASQVAAGTGSLAEAANTANTRVQEIDGVIQQALTDVDPTAVGNEIEGVRADVSDALANDVASLRQKYPDDPDVARLADRLTSVSDKLGTTSTRAQELEDRFTASRDRLSAKADEVAAAVATANNQVGQLNAGAQQVATGASDLSSGVSQLATGARSLSDGANTLASGTDSALEGAGQLADGAGRLRDGLAQLTQGLTDGAASVPVYSDADRENRSQTVADPVTASAERENAVGAYGAGLAPYFLPLALWIGGMITYQILRATPARAHASRASAWRAALAGYLPGVLFGVLQAALLSFVLLTFVGLTTPRPVAFILFLALVAVAFASIHQALVALLGGTGRLVALVYLVLQLASAGGTYAIATSPDFFRALNPLMPLTYAVAGVRALIAGGPIDPVVHGVIAMLITTAISLTVTILAAHRARIWSIKRLHPSLNV